MAIAVSCGLIGFQSSLPVAGERVHLKRFLELKDGMFQSSLPVAGERVSVTIPVTTRYQMFQSSLPVAGERVA